MKGRVLVRRWKSGWKGGLGSKRNIGVVMGGPENVFSLQTCHNLDYTKFSKTGNNLENL